MGLRGDERHEFWVQVAVIVIKPLTRAFTRRPWTGAGRIPRTGGVIVVLNHLSYLDPLFAAHYVHKAGRNPRFMIKRNLFGVFFVGRLFRGAKQIPVDRETSNAGDALRDAKAALEAGEAVVIYPEGTTTKDPDYWPMVGKTGAARLALETGVPVIPVTQWGAQALYGQDGKLHLLPRKTIVMNAGPPVDLSAYAGRPASAAVLRGATATIMGSLRAELGRIRGEQPPAEIWDPKAGSRRPALAVARTTDGSAA